MPRRGAAFGAEVCGATHGAIVNDLGFCAVRRAMIRQERATRSRAGRANVARKDASVSALASLQALCRRTDLLFRRRLRGSTRIA